MLDVSALLEEIKAAPYNEVVLTAPHTGVVHFEAVEPGTTVYGPSGTWKEIPGTRLVTITREKNPRPVLVKEKGVLQSLAIDLEGRFVEAGTPLATMRHYLSRDEVVRIILRKTLFLFNAPEKAKYYFVPEVDKKIKISGPESVKVHDGMELFIISRMKREMSLNYSGQEGVIYEVYFENNQNIDVGSPLIGVCAPEQRDTITDVINRVQSEWKD